MDKVKGTGFKEDKTFEEKMTPYIDLIYRGLFYGIKSIDRSSMSNTKNLLIDKHLGIDSIMRFADGCPIYIQEKTRKYEYRNYDDFTFEYYNDPTIKEEGEWFKLAAQLYFYGYANENLTGYHKYYILDVLRLRLFLKKEIGIDELKDKYLRPNIPPNKANFFAIPFKTIPEKCFLWKQI